MWTHPIQPQGEHANRMQNNVVTAICIYICMYVRLIFMFMVSYEPKKAGCVCESHCVKLIIRKTNVKEKNEKNQRTVWCEARRFNTELKL